jgi:hypothetical protein
MRYHASPCSRRCVFAFLGNHGYSHPRSYGFPFLCIYDSTELRIYLQNVCLLYGDTRPRKGLRGHVRTPIRIYVTYTAEIQRSAAAESCYNGPAELRRSSSAACGHGLQLLANCWFPQSPIHVATPYRIYGPTGLRIRFRHPSGRSPI